MLPAGVADDDLDLDALTAGEVVSGTHGNLVYAAAEIPTRRQGTYVVGIEPSTNRTSGRLPARESGELIVLAPGESRHYDLELGALPGNDAIDAFVSRVAAIGVEES